MKSPALTNRSSRHRRHHRGWLGILIFTLSCGAPTPWSHYKTNNYDELTRVHLEMLTTGSPEYQPFRIGLISDTQMSIGDLKSCIKHINKHENLAFIFHLGDLTERSLRREFEWVARTLKKLTCPVLTVVGNHDGMTYGEKIYKEMWGPLN